MVLGLPHDHLGMQVPCAQGLEHRGQQRVVANESRRVADFAGAAIDKAQGHRLHRHLGGNGGLNQIGMEGLEFQSIAGGAFREDREHIAGLQALGHVLHHAVRVAARLSLDEQGTGTVRKITNEWPAAHVGFGDEAAVARGMHHQNVEPGDVIGHQQHRPARDLRALAHQTHADNLQHLRRPPLHMALPLRRRQARKVQADDPPATHQVQQRAGKPPANAHGLHGRPQADSKAI